MPKISLKSFLQKIKKRHTRATPFVLSSQIGKPEWRCMDYPKLVQEGYEHNVIVYRCINLIARGIASVPWVLYEKDASGIEHEVEHHPLLTLLQHPSAEQAGSSLMEVLMSYLLLSGNAFLEAVFDEYAKPTGLYVLRPDRVALIPGEDGESIGLEYNLSGTRKKIYFSDFPHRPILHLKLFHPLHDVYGLSPLRAAARSIDQHNEVASHNLSLLENGGRPTGALVVKDQNLTFEQRQHLKENLQQLYQGGSNAGKIMILEGEFEWKEMGLSPKDLDFLEGRNISAREIAQAFGVPSMLVGVTGDATYANYKEARLHLWEDTIIPMLEHLMDELNLWLSPLFGNNLRLGFDIDGIPALSEKREAYWDKISQADFLTLNEKRQAVGYSPLPGGDVLGGKMEINDYKICGYASVFYVKDLQNEMVVPGAFLESIHTFKKNKNTVGMYIQHDTTQPLGHWTKLEEDQHGLWAEGQITRPDVYKALLINQQSKGENTYGLSIGFYTKRTSAHNHIKTLHALDLFEISIVLKPANPLATLSGR